MAVLVSNSRSRDPGLCLKAGLEDASLGLDLELSALVNITVYSCLCSRRRYSRAVERRRESGERKREVTVQSEESEKLPGFVAERRHSSATRRPVSVEVFIQHSRAFCCQIKQ